MAVADQLVAARGRRTPRRLGSRLIGCAVALGTVAAVVCWWLGLPEIDHPGPGSSAAITAQLAGLVASVLVCLQLLLAARLPWLARAVGVGPMVRWHRLLGTAVLGLVVVHVLLAVLGAMLLARRTLWSELTVTIFAEPDLVQAVIGTTLIVVAGLTSARIARARLRYEWWYAVHLSVYAGIFLSFAHQVNAGVHFVDSPAVRIGWIVLYALTAVLVVFGRVIGPIYGLLHQGVRVERVVSESPEVVSVWLRGPGLWRLPVRAGQFFFVRFLARGHLLTSHPYSVSRLPGRGRMRLTVGALGDHSSAARHLTPGTRVLLEGPFGTFGSGDAHGSAALLIAGGSGIGPIGALAREFCLAGRDVVLLHRASSLEQLALHDEHRRLPLTFLPLVGRRVELAEDPLCAESLRRRVPDLHAREAFVCGSPGMVSATTAALRTLGVPSARIHREELDLS